MKQLKTGPKYYGKFRFWWRAKGREGGTKERGKGGGRNKTTHVILRTGTNSLRSLVQRLEPSVYRMYVRLA